MANSFQFTIHSYRNYYALSKQQGELMNVSPFSREYNEFPNSVCKWHNFISHPACRWIPSINQWFSIVKLRKNPVTKSYLKISFPSPLLVLTRIRYIKTKSVHSNLFYKETSKNISWISIEEEVLCILYFNVFFYKMRTNIHLEDHWKIFSYQ